MSMVQQKQRVSLYGQRVRVWQRFVQLLKRRPWSFGLGIGVMGLLLVLCLRLDPSQADDSMLLYLKRSLYTGTSGFVGGLVAGVAALYGDRRDCRIQSVEDACRQLQLPLLGAIPCCSYIYGAAYGLEARRQRLDAFEIFNPMDVLRGLQRGRSPVARAYRFLQANLQFLCLHQPNLKVVGVTSTAAKEGKSTVAAGLARALAQRQHRVLLIDANLSQPMQHRIWEMANGIGFSDVLMEGIAPELALHWLLPNLSLLTAGSSLSHPLLVMEAGRSSEHFRRLCRGYDFVILDGPALERELEVSALAQLSDGLLWVLRPGVVDKTTVSKAKSFTSWLHLPLLGLVVNGVTERAQRSYPIFLDP